MDASSRFEPDGEYDGRVIDRSGDIDQRPQEEREDIRSNIVPFRGGLDARTSRGSPDPLEGQRGSAVIPTSHDADAASEPAEMAGRIQRRLDAQHSKAKAQLDAIARKIEAQEKRCIPPKIENELQEVRFQRQKVLISNGPALAGRLREEKIRLADLERFKADNGLTRDAHYPASQIFAIGVLLFLILGEAGVNGVLFADSSDQGLLGGWMEALVLALTNVGAAFLFGRLVLPQFHRRGFSSRIAAATAAVLGVAALLAINLSGAHYRDYRAETARAELAAPRAPSLPPQRGASPADAKSQALTKNQRPSRPGDGISGRTGVLAPASLNPLPSADIERTPSKIAEREAIAKALASPFGIMSFTSFFLAVIGLCGATIAAWDGYGFDDPFPGYGRRHRRYMEARAASGEALRRLLNQSNAFMSGAFQSINRKIEAYAQEVSALQNLHHSFEGEYKALHAGLADAADKAEYELSCHIRLTRKLPQRALDEYFTIAAKHLASLNEKHLKFFETQDRKLKSLQRSALKEQNDVLSMFEAASSDFQRLLSEASAASLGAAFLDAPAQPARAS